MVQANDPIEKSGSLALQETRPVQTRDRREKKASLAPLPLQESMS